MRSNATGRVKSSPPQTLATLASRSVVVSRQQRLARGACGHAGWSPGENADQVGTFHVPRILALAFVTLLGPVWRTC